MNKYETGVYFTTTGEDEQNIFFGETQSHIHTGGAEGISIQPGNYCIMDGQLCRIISGLSPEDVRNRLLLNC